jgi:uncharacterized protein (TIGR01244 family)
MTDYRPLGPRSLVAPRPLTLEEVAGLPALGIARLVNNRPDGEEPGQPSSDEFAAAAAQAGLDYVHAPLGGQLQRETIEEVARALRQKEGKTLLFCRSGTRSAMLWALGRARMGGNPDEIAAEAAAAGYDIAPVRAGVDAFAGR